MTSDINKKLKDAAVALALNHVRQYIEDRKLFWYVAHGRPMGKDRVSNLKSICKEHLLPALVNQIYGQFCTLKGVEVEKESVPYWMIEGF